MAQQPWLISEQTCLSLEKATGAWKQTKPKNKSFYIPLCVHWLYARAYSQCGSNYFGPGPYPPSKRLKWEHYMAVQYLGQHLSFITRKQHQRAWHSVHNISSPPHSGSLIAEEANRGEGNVNQEVIKSVEWACILKHWGDKRLHCVHINLGTVYIPLYLLGKIPILSGVRQEKAIWGKQILL